MPISTNLNPANRHDSSLLFKTMNRRMINCNTKKYRNHNRYKQYLLADKGYDSKKNHNFLKKRVYSTYSSKYTRY